MELINAVQPDAALCESDAAPLAVGASAELLLGDQWIAGVGAWQTQAVGFTQTLPGEVEVNSDMTIRGYEVYGGVNIPLSDRVSVRGTGGWSLHRNKATFTGPGGTVEREHTGGRALASTGFDLHLTDDLRLDATYTYRTAGKDDADTSHGLGLSLAYSFSIHF
jgi:hypothetical protein